MPADRRTARFVLACWAVLAGACVWYSVRHAVNAPYTDEWDLAAGLTGSVPVSHFVLGHHNEHRYPLGQLAWYVVTAAAGYDFRPACVANVTLMAALAYGLVRLAARVGGRPHPADVLLPALLLNFGHAEKWVMGYQLTLTVPLAAFGGILAAAATCRPGNEARAGWVAGGLLLVVMTAGAYGLASVPPVVAWVAYLAWRVWRADRRPGQALGLLILSAVAVAYTAFCVATMPPAVTARPHLTPEAVVFGALQGLGCTAGGWLGTHHSPWPGLVVLAVNLVVVVQLLRALADPAERPRAVGLAAVWVSMLVAGAGVLLARGGFADRNALPLAFHGCAAVIALRVYPLRVGRWTSAALGVAAAAAVVVGNWAPGLDYGRVHRFKYAAFRADLRAGMPVAFLAEKHFFPMGGIDRSGVSHFASRIDDLRAAQIGWFRDAVPTPPLAEAADAQPADVQVGAGEGSAPVPGPGRFVHGARVTVRADSPTAWTQLVLEWPGGESSVHLPLTTAEQTVSFWVNASPERVRFRMALQPTTAHVVAIRWLAPAGE